MFQAAIYICSRNGIPINYSLTRSLYNDHRSTSAFNFFPGSWSVSRVSNWTDHRFARRSITFSPFESPWNAIWDSSGDSSSPRKRKVLTKDSRGNVRSPRCDYRIPAATLLDRVYRRRLSFPCSHVLPSKRRSVDDFVSPPS